MSEAIVLQFAASDSLGGHLIQWYGHGWCSHVDSVLPDGRLLGARYEGGVLIRPPGYTEFTRTLVVTLPTTAEVVAAYDAFLAEQLGKPYDSEGIFDFVTGRDWRSDGTWFCSELVGRGLEVAKYFAFPLATPANKLTPPDLLLALSARVEIRQAA